MIHFEIPKNQSSIIKVIGVGGGGGNAVNYMHSLDIDGVDFIICNTDSQALERSAVPNKIQLGPHLTQGLGAGANPEIGKQASEESFDDIAKLLKVNTKMAFVTAGMGGGTGTGGAPVVAKICRDLGILTVGIVTTPFSYEGRKRLKQAQDGIDRLREHVDTILIISNDKMRQQFGNLSFTKAFEKADDILATAAKCITDVINTTGQINVDFADVCTVMKNGGVAILGSAQASGESRAQKAVEDALNSPLLNDSDINGAKWILLNITSAEGEFEHTLDEAETIQAYVQQQAGENCDVILGMGHDPNLGEELAVTIIATGFHHKDLSESMPNKDKDPNKIVVELKQTKVENESLQMPVAAPAENTTTAYSMEPTLNEVKPEINNVVPATTLHDKISLQLNEQTEDNTFNFSFVNRNNEVETPAVNTTPTAGNDAILDRIQQTVQEEKKELSTFEMKVAERELSDFEKDEQRIFEEQKKSLEDRAERLRKMSFDFNRGESADDIENVPAYMRRQVALDDEKPGNNNISNYTVGFNNEGEQQASIQTINTFLDGNKPD